ncbi:MAG: lipopolysaccharide transport periplasmic protein LptA [Pseudomonadales bacterium]|nr:lipopolysaccharide transport periplasmic protein LptA [Pseudomonadales bacterium]
MLIATTAAAQLPASNGTTADHHASTAAPIAIEADAAEQDEKKGVTTYRGNVAIVQGPLSIKADKVQIISRSDGEKRNVEKITASGSPAIFTHQAINVADNISAEANNIDYHLLQGRVLLENRASLVQQGSSVSGDSIEYFIAEKRVKAAAGSRSGNGQNGRVRTVITPGSGMLFGSEN